MSSPTNMKLKAERVLGNARPALRKIINLAELYLLADFFAAAHRFFCASAILARASALSLRIGRLLATLVLLGDRAYPRRSKEASSLPEAARSLHQFPQVLNQL